MSESPIKFTAKMSGSFEVARKLRRHPDQIGRTLYSLVKQEARGLAVELARNTRPFGFSEKAKHLGEKAVAKDIVKVFALPSDAYEPMRLLDPVAANRFWANIQNRRFSRAQKTLQSSNSTWKSVSMGRLDPNLHKASRVGPNKNVTRKSPAQIVTSEKARSNYIAKIQKRVGFAKATWINAAKTIGGRIRGSAQWVTRHKRGQGTAIMKTGAQPSVTLVNNLDYIDDVSTQTGINLALQIAAGRLKKALMISLLKVNQRANRDINSRAS